MLWHIMNIYAAHGFREFVVALGYKQEVVKNYFLNFLALNNNLTIDLASGETTVHENRQPSWKVHLIDTGAATDTGGRVLRLREWIGNSRFMLTYGDGVANVDIRNLVEFHTRHGRLATVTAVRPPSRFGSLRLGDRAVVDFEEKPQTGEGWINGGFFVLEPGVFDYLAGDTTVFEREPLERLARDGQLAAYRHEGFWQPMDTLREKKLLQSLWDSNAAPWKLWT
jgi:glucose-1-phosphate cytidylyltransferase